MNNLVLPNGKIKNIKMVIFDKDGTLIDVHFYWCSMIKFRAQFFIDELKGKVKDSQLLYNELIDNMGINLTTNKMKPEGPVGIKPRSFIIDIALKTIKKHTKYYTKEDVIKVFNSVDEYSKTKLHNIVKPLDGVIELLKNLQENNILASIATTDLTTRAILAMKDLKLEKFFSDIVGSDLVKEPKPSADLIEYILDKNNLQKEDIVLVGDSMADLNMAKNAKCKFLAVKTGLYTNEFILKSEYLVDNLKNVEVMK